MAQLTSLAFLPKLLLQHDASPESVLEDVQVGAARCRGNKTAGWAEG